MLNRKTKWAIAALFLLLLAGVWWRFDGINSSSSALMSAGVPDAAPSSSVYIGTSVSQAPQIEGAVTDKPDLRAPLMDKALTVSEAARTPELSTLLNEVRRSSDLFLREYVVYAPAELCFATIVARSNEILPLLDSKQHLVPKVKAELGKSHAAALDRIGQRCTTYSGDGHLRDALARELNAARAPLTTIKNTLLLTNPNLSAEDNKRSMFDAVQAVFASPNAPLMLYMTNRGVARMSQPFVSTMIPKEYSGEEVQFIAMYAAQIAACRAGAPCEQGTIARDTVCARYGECDAPDVEGAYRRLHQLYEVPFSVTESVVAQYQQALAQRSARILLRD